MVVQQCQTHRTPLLYEPISVAKATKCVVDGRITGVTYITPNEDELMALAAATGFRGARSKAIDSLKAQASWLLDRGVQHVVVTIGPRGVLVASRSLGKVARLPAERVASSSIRSTSGAGDNFVAGFAAALAAGE